MNDKKFPEFVENQIYCYEDSTGYFFDVSVIYKVKEIDNSFVYVTVLMSNYPGYPIGEDTMFHKESYVAQHSTLLEDESIS